MNQAPSNPIPQTDIDDSYRRASALDPGRPGEWVRRKVLVDADAHNQTPLHAAIAGGQSSIVIILKHSGAK